MKTLIIFILASFSLPCFSQQGPKPLKPVDWQEVAAAKAKVEAHPDSLSYHEAYLKAIGWVSELYWHAEEYKSRFDSTVAEMQAQYSKWINQFPQNAVVYEAIGSAYYESESPKATEYLKKTVELDPRSAKTYLKLAIDAERWGDQKAAMEFMRLAAETDPNDPAYSFYYTMYFDEIDMAVFRQKIFELAKKFPEHERGAQGLYWLAYDTKGIEEKIQIYEQLRTLYPPLKFSWSESAMSLLFNNYLLSDQYDKAISLAESLISKRGWPERIGFAKGFAKVQALINDGRHKEAYDSILVIKSNRLSSQLTKITLLEAELAYKTGNTTAAYETLLQLQAKAPTDELLNAINTYAKQLGKDGPAIDNDIWAIRAKTTKKATPFDLGLYTSTSKAKLSDYEGKVVLLTFWFPGCGPCRAEFPHFENVVQKFKGKDLAYLGINVFPNQDDYVLPFMKGTKYSFTPLRATSEWALEAYQVRGEPTNFLIDKQGNIVYANFRTDNENERTLELMISSLLEKK